MIRSLLHKTKDAALPTEKRFFGDEAATATYWRDIEAAKAGISGVHQHYVTNISSPTMAASLELAGALYALCSYKQPRRMMDIGSGFTSYVLRKWQAEHGGTSTVVSVDDDADWLEKTRDYLAGNGVRSDKLLTFDALMAGGERDFDIILHDMNFVEVRRNYIGEVIDRTAPGGLMIFDDVHKMDYFNDVVKALRGRSIRFYSFRSSTLDSFKRYSIIAVK
jgi:predicted O-methyltransferase YrrM